jgi:hypothetical protein
MMKRRRMTASDGGTELIWAVVIAIVLMVVLALYGYLTGAWERDPLNSGYGISENSRS